MRIGVIGLGRMGGPIARTLVRAHAVSGFDADAARASAIDGTGVTLASSVSELVRRSEVVITVLPGAQELDDVLAEAGEDVASGSVWLDLTTGDPRVTDRWVGFFGTRAVHSVSAPMGGGPHEANNSSLHFTVAGAAEGVERIRPILELLSTPDGVEVIGADPHHAQVVKLLSNVLWFGQVIAVTEALLLGQRLGIDPPVLRELLAARAGSSVMLERDYAAVFEGDYLPAFGLDRVTDQLAVAASIAAEHAVPFELSALVERTHRAALQQFGAISGELLAARLLEERAGTALRDPMVR